MKNISLMILVVFAMALTCHCQVDFVGSFVNIIFGLHSWDSGKQVPFLEVKCYPSSKGRISSFKWKWDAKLECTGRLDIQLVMNNFKNRISILNIDPFSLNLYCFISLH